MLDALYDGYTEKMRGLSAEDWIIEYLKVKYPTIEIEKVTDRNLQHQDVDAIVNKKMLSFKDQTRGCGRSGNVSFELEVYYEPKKEWQPGNYAKSIAFAYIIKVDDTLYYIRKDRLAEFIKNTNYPVKQHTERTKYYQIRMGHPHTDARNLLIPLEDLLQNQIAEIV